MSVGKRFAFESVFGLPGGHVHIRGAGCDFRYSGRSLRFGGGIGKVVEGEIWR